MPFLTFIGIKCVSKYREVKMADTGDRVQVNVSDPTKPVRVIEVPLQRQTPGINWVDVAQEVKSGIWAVALVFLFIWISTAKLRDHLIGFISDYTKRHLALLDTVKETSMENNILIKKMLSEMEVHRRLSERNGHKPD